MNRNKNRNTRNFINKIVDTTSHNIPSIRNENKNEIKLEKIKEELSDKLNDKNKSVKLPNILSNITSPEILSVLNSARTSNASSINVSKNNSIQNSPDISDDEEELKKSKIVASVKLPNIKYNWTDELRKRRLANSVSISRKHWNFLSIGDTIAIQYNDGRFNGSFNKIANKYFSNNGNIFSLRIDFYLNGKIKSWLLKLDDVEYIYWDKNITLLLCYDRIKKESNKLQELLKG